MPCRRPPFVVRLACASALLPALAFGVASTSPSPDPSGAGSLRSALEPEPLRSPAGMVVTSSEAASRAGAEVLEAGGNAVDAAVAAAFTLGASDPSESGLGGESWILVQLAGRPPVAIVCPSAVPLRVDREALRRARAAGVLTGHATAAVPTSVASLARALSRFGTMRFAEVLAPAIAEAERGWELGWTEASVVRANAWRLSLSPLLAGVLLPGPCDPNGYPSSAAVGSRLRLPALAGTLRRLAEAGPDDFYLGALAGEIDADMRAHGGFVRKEDLARVPANVHETEPARVHYRDREVLSVGPPAAGGILAGTLAILQRFSPELVASRSADAHQLLLDAVRIAREDARATAARGRSSAGGMPAFLEAGRAEERAREIRPGTAWNAGALRAPAAAGPSPGEHTTQVSVVDGAGNAVSITQTLGADWGSASAGEKLGFPYNAVLAWFELENRAHPAFLGPRASLPVPSAPAIVLKDGRVELVLGSPGSSRIVPAIVSVVRNVVDGGMELAEAVAAPRLLWQDEGTIRRVVAEVAGDAEEKALVELAKRGYSDAWVVRGPGADLAAFGCVNAVGWNARARAWEGVGDPRRRGVAAAPTAPRPRQRDSSS